MQFSPVFERKGFKRAHEGMTVHRELNLFDLDHNFVHIFKTFNPQELLQFEGVNKVAYQYTKKPGKSLMYVYNLVCTPLRELIVNGIALLKQH